MFHKKRKKIVLNRTENSYSTNLTGSYSNAISQAEKERIMSIQSEENKIITNLNKIRVYQLQFNLIKTN